MDASAPLERLRDISSQVRAAVVFERGGKVVGSSIGDEERAQRVAREAGDLLAEAERRQSGTGGEFAQLEVALQAGSVFVVRHGELLIAATTPPEPTVGLVFYDLKSCLRELDDQASKNAVAKKKRAPATKATPTPRSATRAKKTDAKP